MNNPDRSSAVVTLKQLPAEGNGQVTVGITIFPSYVTVDVHLSYEDLECPAAVHATTDCLKRYDSQDQLLLACGISAVGGITKFRNQHPNKIDYRLTALVGENLDFESIAGFALAGFMSAARAAHSAADAKIDISGWTEVT